MPQLLVLGDYEPDQGIGPAIWLRCVVDRTITADSASTDEPYVVYMPEVSRQQLTAPDCPDLLKPLVELQYRGVCWKQKNGRDWTPEAFLTSSLGGLGLDVAQDGGTRHSMSRALRELAATPVTSLQGKRLQSEDFDQLISDDPVRDLLVWLDNPDAARSRWDEARWSTFKSRCQANFGFDPVRDGEVVAAERLSRSEGPWQQVWRRFEDAPAMYSGVPKLLRRLTADDLLDQRPTLPQSNDQGEDALRRLFRELGTLAQDEVRRRLLEADQSHRVRREWVWAKLGDAPLAQALKHLVELAERTSTELGGASLLELAQLYADGAWRADAAALASMSAVDSSADWQVVQGTLRAIYEPWLESAARQLQALAEKEPLPGCDQPRMEDVEVSQGTVILFADGLRFDVAQDLAARLREQGGEVSVSTRWAALPTVTATAKPAVSPIVDQIEGTDPGQDFLPLTTDSQRPLTTDRFRKLLAEAGCPYLEADQVGDPSQRAWTEYGDLDKLGHSLQGKLANNVDNQVNLLAERIEALRDAGWREVRVVTDHGWLWLPGGLPKTKLPKYLVRSRWARCAAVAGDSAVEVPTVGWHWNVEQRIALAPGISCFWAGNDYAHGGMSLQECLIPVMRVTDTGLRKSKAELVSVSWHGLRCRISLANAHQGFSADLRLRVNDPESSVSGQRALRDDGTVSLLVAEDDLKGDPASVVILDLEGRVIARQSTTIGGEE